MTERPANRLVHEKSPYLLQHAHDPVDWYPWGSEALERARVEDRPIFLSIGYAACHWCHVMERESFEDAALAAFMNERFVSIKVDREERPDLDGIYMDAVQHLNRGQGGWPMSVFLTPEGRPFYAGTYFPPEPRHGLPSFRQVLEGMDAAWRERRDEVEKAGAQVTAVVGGTSLLTPPEDPLSEEVAAGATDRLVAQADPRWGGFGTGPTKFPQPMTLEFLLRRAVRGDGRARSIVELTLDKMAAGGIYDHLGGGFARYATDPTWHVPHFEKMLYDNAQLLQLYARAGSALGKQHYRTVARETATYLLRELQHPEGAFYSSQDADSEGVEGKFFTWAWEELVSEVGEPVATALGARPEGNWDGTNVLWRPAALEQVAVSRGLDLDELANEVDDARRLLFELRSGREHPAVDDKILAGWNGLAIRSLAEAGSLLGDPDLVAEAARCADFVLSHLRDDRGRLLRSWRGGVAHIPAFADDHALLASGCLALYEATGELRWFTEAHALAQELLSRFADTARGGFFQTADDADPLVVRPKELYDNAVPSGNAAAAEVFQRMALLTGDASLEAAAERALRLVKEPMLEVPAAFGHALCALDLFLGPAHEVAVIGSAADPRTEALVRVVRGSYRPNVVLATAEPGDAAAEAEVRLLAGRGLLDGYPAAYVCQRFACRAPVTEPEALRADLGA
jgi:uncharacterized protein